VVDRIPVATSGNADGTGAYTLQWASRWKGNKTASRTSLTVRMAVYGRSDNQNMPYNQYVTVRIDVFARYLERLMTKTEE
jgi:hypothetical protein